MDAIAELGSRSRALAQEAKALILGQIRDGRPIEQNQVKELQREAEQIDAELQAAYDRGGSDDGGGVREPVRPRPPSRGPGIAVVPPRE